MTMNFENHVRNISKNEKNNLARKVAVEKNSFVLAFQSYNEN